MTSVVDYLFAQNHNIHVAVTEFGQFMRNLPSRFYKNGDEGEDHHPKDVNFFLSDYEDEMLANTSGKVVKVENQEDLAELRERLMKKPIFLNVKLESEYVDEREREKVYAGQNCVVATETLAAEICVMVYINPTHPFIKEQLEKHFNKCERLMSKRKHFSFEIRVDKIIKAWYMRNIGKNCSSCVCHGSTICVTNFRQRCNICYSSSLWFNPCAWVIAPPYLIYRALKSKDIICDLSAVVTSIEQGHVINTQQNMIPGYFDPPPPYVCNLTEPPFPYVEPQRHGDFVPFPEMAPQN